MKNTLKILSALFISLFTINFVIGQECYELIWSDEFNYNGLPDSTKWSYEVGANGWGNNESQYYTKNRLENSRVEDSVLVIEARKETFDGAQYTSARLITYPNKHYWKYGKVEARLKLPFGQGIWPAFWMLGRDIFEGTGWPASGEIDIMEMIGGGEGRDDVTHGTIHWADANGNHAMYGNSYQLDEGIFNDDFHVFAVEWDAQQIRWLLDGTQFHAVDITPSSLSEFHEQFFILLNIAVGGDWPGYPNESTTFPQQMVVDYVRVYQKNQTPEIEGKKKVISNESSLTYSLIESTEFTYNWSVPQGAEIIKGQGTHEIKVNWGCEPGNVTCQLTTVCNTYNLELPIELTKLNITGDTIVSENQENLTYSVPFAINTYYTWVLPEMVSSTTQLDTNAVTLNWGSKDGTLKLITENNCGKDTATLNIIVNRQLPYPDPNTPHAIPGTIESVHFDMGGEGIAYHDADATNNGTGSRQDEGVDTEANDGSENIGWTEAGEWLEYTVNIEETKNYDLEVRLASINSTGKFKILFNGTDRTGEISSPNTGSWSGFQSVYVKDIELNTDDTLMRVEITGGDFNLGRLRFADSIPVGVHQNQVHQIKVFPTLAKNTLNIIPFNDEDLEYSIADLSGKTIKSGILGSQQLNVGFLTPGLYIIRIKNEAGIISKKFIKE